MSARTASQKIQQKGLQLLPVLAAKAQQYSSKSWVLLQKRWPFVYEGLTEAFYGSRDTLQHAHNLGVYKNFLITYLITLSVFYGIALTIGLTILAPVTAILLFLAPGILLQLALMMSNWAYEIAREKNPQALDQLFLSEAKSVNPQLAAQLRPHLANRQSTFVDRLIKRFSKMQTYFKRSMYLSLLGFIPIVGPIIASIGTLVLTSERVAYGLMEPYFEGKGWDAATKATFMHKHRWNLVGFAMPFALVNAIPGVGAIAMTVAQGATAHMVMHLAKIDGDSFDVEDTHSRTSTGQTAGQTKRQSAADHTLTVVFDNGMFTTRRIFATAPLADDAQTGGDHPTAIRKPADQYNMYSKNGSMSIDTSPAMIAATGMQL